MEGHCLAGCSHIKTRIVPFANCPFDPKQVEGLTVLEVYCEVSEETREKWLLGNRDLPQSQRTPLPCFSPTEALRILDDEEPEEASACV